MNSVVIALAYLICVVDLKYVGDVVRICVSVFSFFLDTELESSVLTCHTPAALANKRV